MSSIVHLIELFWTDWFLPCLCFSQKYAKIRPQPFGYTSAEQTFQDQGCMLCWCVDEPLRVISFTDSWGGGREKLSMLRYSQTTEAGQANLGESFKIQTINHIPESPLSSLYATLSTHTLESPLSSLYPTLSTHTLENPLSSLYATLSTHTLENPLSSLYPTLSTHTLENPLSSLYPTLLPLHPSMFSPGNLGRYKSWEWHKVCP